MPQQFLDTNAANHTHIAAGTARRVPRCTCVSEAAAHPQIRPARWNKTTTHRYRPRRALFALLLLTLVAAPVLAADTAEETPTLYVGPEPDELRDGAPITDMSELPTSGSTYALVEGARIPLPRNADGTCDSGDNTALGILAPDHLLGRTKRWLTLRIDYEACEVVVTRARVKKKAREVLFAPEPTTPEATPAPRSVGGFSRILWRGRVITHLRKANTTRWIISPLVQAYVNTGLSWWDDGWWVYNGHREYHNVSTPTSGPWWVAAANTWANTYGWYQGYVDSFSLGIFQRWWNGHALYLLSMSSRAYMVGRPNGYFLPQCWTSRPKEIYTTIYYWECNPYKIPIIYDVF